MKKRDWLPWKYEIVPWMTKAFTPVKSRSLSNKMKHDFVIVSWTLKVSIFSKSTLPFWELKIFKDQIIPITMCVSIFLQNTHISSQAS